ncbi:MAG: Gfo/Idh/MocA family oxidoreductase [Planctomycetota bacterium]|nr:Gfo/Idh/MocA family oxidoreductase [Planctomycetota bacterium]
MAKQINRREFLKYSAMAAAVAGTGPMILRGQENAKKVNVGFIGVGGRGRADLDECAKAGCNVVALCDVDRESLSSAARRYPGTKTYSDYRKLFEQKDIEAVCIGTPDHHHFPASMMAITRGKHVYCEKPLTHSIWEARQVAKAARDAKVATQMGTQGSASEGIRLLAEWIGAGAIGNVKEVHIWTDRPAGWWPQSVDRPAGEDPVPPGLNWDCWIGPAPMRPFKNGVYHGFKWRGWWDFGTCALGDIGCHAMNWPWWALKLTAPTRVEAVQSGQKKETGPAWSNIGYQFPANGDRNAMKMFWYDGRNAQTPKDSRQWKELLMLHELAELGDRAIDVNGQLYIGDKGKILINGDTPRLMPESAMREFKRPEKTIPRNKLGHHGEWLAACIGDAPARANFEYAGPLAEAVLLGNVALRLEKKIEWDSVNLKATNAPEAAGLIKREYRKGWEV